LRTPSRRPVTALLAIGLLMTTLGLGVLLLQALSNHADPATVKAQEGAPSAIDAH